MPDYTWKDNNSGRIVVVTRKISDITAPPDKDEAIEQGMDVESFSNAEWERGMFTPPAFTGPKGKGYW